MIAPRSAKSFLMPAGVIVTARHAYLLNKRTNINQVRRFTRGLDPEFTSVLVDLRRLAMSYVESSDLGPSNGSVIGQVADPDEEWNSERVADHLGITTRSVSKAITSGRLLATKVNGRWIIRRSDLDQFADDRSRRAKRR